MKRKVLFLILFAVSVGASAQTRVIAHRGFWDTDNSAQNSITAIYKAAEANCYAAEFDVQMTADGELIVFHDSRVGLKKIATTAFAALRDHRLKNGEILPTLEQYLIHFGNCERLKLVLELKTDSDITAENRKRLVAKTLAMVDKYRLQVRTEYIAFDVEVCKEVLTQRRDAAVYYLNGDLSAEQVKAYGFAGIDYHYSLFLKRPTLVEEAQRLGLKVNAWTVNSTTVMQELIDMGVDFITTDKPLEATDLL